MKHRANWGIVGVAVLTAIIIASTAFGFANKRADSEGHGSSTTRMTADGGHESHG